MAVDLLLLLGPAPVEYGEYAVALRKEFPEVNVITASSANEALPYMDSVEILMTFGAQLRDSVLACAKRLVWIQSLGTGVDGIVDAPSLERSTVVTNIRGVHGAAVSEAAFAAMLALSRDLPRSFAAQANHHWDRFSPRLLDGRTIGILGVGAIAEDLAPRCKAFGMRVVGITQRHHPVPSFNELRSRIDLERVVGDLDFLIVLIPRTPETKGIVNAEVLRAMKAGSFLVNLARGGIVDEGALVAALAHGPLSGAALDVFEYEPLAADHAFWSCKNLIITPHLAGSAREYPALSLPQIIHNLRFYLSHGTSGLVNVVKA